MGARNCPLDFGIEQDLDPGIFSFLAYFVICNSETTVLLTPREIIVKSAGSGADSKLGLTMVRPSLQSAP